MPPLISSFLIPGTCWLKVGENSAPEDVFFTGAASREKVTWHNEVENYALKKISTDLFLLYTIFLLQDPNHILTTFCTSVAAQSSLDLLTILLSWVLLYSEISAEKNAIYP